MSLHLGNFLFSTVRDKKGYLKIKIVGIHCNKGRSVQIYVEKLGWFSLTVKDRIWAEWQQKECFMNIG